MIQKIDSQKGIAQFLVIAVMAFLALGIPATTKLVQENQENRSKAASEYISEQTTTTLNATRVPTRPPILINTNQINFHHNFAPKDYSIRKIGSVLINDILIKTGGKKIDTATIVYCYTDLLKPDFNSVSGEQIAKVVSNKEIGNNCAEVKVIFNDKQLVDALYEQYTDYVLSYKVTVAKYGRGMLGIDCTKSSLIDKNGEEIIANDPSCGYYNGTDFTISDPLKVSPTTTPISRPTLVPTRPPITRIPTQIPTVPGAYLYFEPDKKEYKVGDIFQLAVLADSGSNEINGITVYGKYDSSKLELISMKKSTSKPFGDIGDCHNLTNKDYGKFNFNFTCYTTNTYDQMKVKGELIKLTFKAKSAGLVKVQFVCNKDSAEPTSTISNSADHKNFTNCDKNINANIIITESAVINGACGSPKYNQLTPTSGKENAKILCKSGKVSEFSHMTPNCSNPSNSTNCPPAFYSWKCLGSNGGKSVKCSIKSPTTNSYTIPATGIKVTPTSLKLKVGQTAKISYVLTPKDTTNPVYSSIVGPKDLVKVTQTTPPCPSGANCAAAQGVRYYNVTALKSGSVKIYFRTSSGKSGSSTILINK